VANLDANYDIDHRADAIAHYQDGVLVCLAGPGTGKTYSFLLRIRSLTTEQHVAAGEICYLTFIKEISRAFIADYEEKLEAEADEAHRSRISTLHSFACRLIRNQGFRHGFDGPLYFMSVADSKDYHSKGV
jgi:superfamily I DNA/RNA helicase